MKVLAKRLWDARQNKLVISLDTIRLPETEAQAYEAQDIINGLSGHQMLGFKVGSTSKEAQQFLGVNGPNYAALLSPYVHDSPAKLSVVQAQTPHVEGEFVFRLGDDLPARSTPYELDEIRSAIAAVAGAIEIVGCRIADGLSTVGPLLLTADGGANIALVVGPWHSDWSTVDFAAQRVSVFINGKLHGQGTGARALGNPLNVLQWLANKRSQFGQGLRRGEIVSTGTCTGLDRINNGDQVMADFGTLGRVEITF